MNRKILFIGSHLSKSTGTKGISEKIYERLNKDYNIKLVSTYKNKLLRFLDIVTNALFSNYQIMHIDVYSNKGFIYADIASLIAKLRNKKLIMTLRGGKLAEKFQNEPTKMKKVFNRADYLQSPSLFLIDFFKKYNINIKYMPNFIDLKFFPYNRKKIEKYSLLWVRAFSEEYQPELAIKVFYKIKKKYPNTIFYMIGPDKGNLNECKKLSKELGIYNDIKFLGKVKNEELFKFYNKCHVYLNTTKYESFGVAVLEAAACGIPIISTNVGEIPFLWEDNKDILLVENNDIEGFEKNIIKIFEDDSFASKLSLNARKKAENYDWNLIKKKWVDLLNNI